MTGSNQPLLPPELALPKPPEPARRIFVNRNLRLDQIQAVGFDMDYTVARYHRQAIEELAHRLTVEKLIGRGYPDEIRHLRYDPEFVIRGLTVDRELGNILKLDRHNHVGRAYHGRQPIPKEQRRELYRREKIHFIPPRFALVDTLFSLPEVCLYADLVDYLDRHPNRKHINYSQLWDDTRECIDEAHRDDTLKSIVLSDLPKFIERDADLARTLHKLRSSGKKLFLLTNSFCDYTEALMTFLLEGELVEYPDWRRYFEVVIVGARKPAFFTGREPFVQLDAEGQPTAREVTQFERGVIYQGGNLKDLERLMGLGGEQVLYVGDHIFGHILRSKKASLWRTALIIEDLESEVARTLSVKPQLDRINELEVQRRQLDELANLQRQQLSAIERAFGDKARQRPEFEALRLDRDENKRKLKELIAQIATLQTEVDRTFNRYWGMVFKEIGANSRFADQVTDYACIYTSRVSNFLGYSTYQYFRSPSDAMPHEQE